MFLLYKTNSIHEAGFLILGFIMIPCFKFRAQSPKLKTGYRYENQFWIPGFTNGVRQFCGYQKFCYEILFYSVSSYSPFLLNLLNQNLQNFKTPKRKLWSFVQRSEYLFVIILIINIFKFSHTLCSLNDIMKATQHPNPVNVHKMCLYWHETISYFP